MRRRLKSWLVRTKRRALQLTMGRRFRRRALVYCGVHKGWAFGRRLHYFDRAIGFEPIPELFEELQRKFRRDRRVTLVNAALAPECGTAKFYVHDTAPASSLSVLGPEYQERQGRAISVEREIEVQCVNLGEWLAENGITDVDTLVTDIQGHDLSALRTCSDLVRNRRIRLIRCEVERVHPEIVDVERHPWMRAHTFSPLRGDSNVAIAFTSKHSFLPRPLRRGIFYDYAAA